MELIHTLGLAYMCVACVFIAISVPLVLRKIPMNNFYGFRIGKAFESDEMWYKINAFGGKQFIFWSVILLLIGMAHFVPAVEEASDVLQMLMFYSPILTSAIAVVCTLVYAAFL